MWRQTTPRHKVTLSGGTSDLGPGHSMTQMRPQGQHLHHPGAQAAHPAALGTGTLCRGHHTRLSGHLAVQQPPSSAPDRSHTPTF